MPDASTNDPLHGVTLKAMVTALEAHYGFDELGRRIDIRCFTDNPSLASGTEILRSASEAQDRVEAAASTHFAGTRMP